MDIFSGTADYYDRFRLGVTDEVAQTILQTVPEPTHLLDLGTGTGRVLEQFVPHFRDTIAVEPDPAMLKLAKRRLMKYPVRFLHATAEEVGLPDGWQASLVTICRAFHWMDRERVLSMLNQVVLPHGTVAVFSDHSFWHLPEAWSEIIQHTLKDFLGPERRTTLGTYRPPTRPFKETLLDSPFSDVREYMLPVERHWLLDDIIGYLYSTSFASRQVLGDSVEAFEKTVRERLLAFSPSGEFVEHNRFDLLIATRPA